MSARPNATGPGSPLFGESDGGPSMLRRFVMSSSRRRQRLVSTIAALILGPKLGINWFPIDDRAHSPRLSDTQNQLLAIHVSRAGDLDSSRTDKSRVDGWRLHNWLETSIFGLDVRVFAQLSTATRGLPGHPVCATMTFAIARAKSRAQISKDAA